MNLFDVARRNLAAEGCGIPSYCTANDAVLMAILRRSAARGTPVLVEATCNQVNQDGGYTGMRPGDFARSLRGRAEALGIGADRLMLGGDHLGPNPWRRLPAEEAMRRAHRLVTDYVEAGFEKIHLDASMPLGGDPPVLDTATIAERAADLCLAAERAATGMPPSYVIGTEVPVPGGESGGLHSVRVTRGPDLAETVEAHRQAFGRRGIPGAFERVLAVVAQPGVDFDQTSVLGFDPEKGREVGAAIAALGPIVGEAHSTDYQAADALAALVACHFPILKVGPELTFAYRSAILDLGRIERMLVPEGARADVEAVVLERMNAAPEHWAGYYEGEGSALRRLQLLSFSDRIRYYWPDPAVETALRRLFATLATVRIPPILWRAAFPDLDADRLRVPTDAVEARIDRVLARYEAAAALA